MPCKAVPGCREKQLWDIVAVAQVLRFLESRKAQGEGGWKLPGVDHAPGFLRYSHANASSHAHEAGHVPLSSPPLSVPCSMMGRIVMMRRIQTVSAFHTRLLSP